MKVVYERIAEEEMTYAIENIVALCGLGWATYFLIVPRDKEQTSFDIIALPQISWETVETLKEMYI